MATGLALAVLLVAANGFFVAAEFAIARLRPTQVADFVREGRPGARSAEHAVSHIDAYLSACQLGITLSSLGLGALGEPAFHALLEPVFGDEAHVLGFGLASVIAFSIITVLHVVLGELSPKSLAIARTGPVSLMLAPPMRLFYLLTKPIVDLFNGMGNLVLKPFGVPPASEAGHAPHTEDELRELLRESGQQGTLALEESRLSERALLFGDLRAREIMHPRAEVEFLTTSAGVREAIDLAIETGHTRFPLCEPEGGLDTAVAVVNAKDLLPAAAGRADGVQLTDLARPLARVHEATRVDELLRVLRQERRHIALVVDEHGTVVGLLTLEDVLEELVGEIEDEFDPEQEALLRREDGALRIDGSAPLRLVAERLTLDLDTAHEATIGGHVIEELGRVPQAGETVELHGTQFEVLRADDVGVEELRARQDVQGPAS